MASSTMESTTQRLLQSATLLSLNVPSMDKRDVLMAVGFNDPENHELKKRLRHGIKLHVQENGFMILETTEDAMIDLDLDRAIRLFDDQRRCARGAGAAVNVQRQSRHERAVNEPQLAQHVARAAAYVERSAADQQPIERQFSVVAAGDLDWSSRNDARPMLVCRSHFQPLLCIDRDRSLF